MDKKLAYAVIVVAIVVVAAAAIMIFQNSEKSSDDEPVKEYHIKDGIALHDMHIFTDGQKDYFLYITKIVNAEAGWYEIYSNVIEQVDANTQVIYGFMTTTPDEIRVGADEFKDEGTEIVEIGSFGKVNCNKYYVKFNGNFDDEYTIKEYYLDGNILFRTDITEAKDGMVKEYSITLWKSDFVVPY